MSHFIIEKKIWDKIFKDNGCSSHFEYEKDISTGKYILKLITYNPKHQVVFIAYQAKGKDKLETTKNILNMIEEPDNAELNNYSVSWINKKEKYISFFKAKDIHHLLEKFNFQKNESIQINEIKKIDEEKD